MNGIIVLNLAAALICGAAFVVTGSAVAGLLCVANGAFAYVQLNRR